MTRGEEIMLKALRKEHARLVKVASAAKAKFEATNGAGLELIAIRKEWVAVASHKVRAATQKLRELDALETRMKRAEKLRQQDILKLIDRQVAAEFDCRALGSELANLELRLSIQSEGLL